MLLLIGYSHEVIQVRRSQYEGEYIIINERPYHPITTLHQIFEKLFILIYILSSGRFET